MTRDGKTELHRGVPIGSLLFATMFFSTWGSGMQKLSPVDLSKIFPALSLLVVLYAALFVKRKLVFPRAFNWFLAFYALHAVLVYALIHPEELVFGALGSTTQGENFVSVAEGAGLVLTRVALFASFGLAFASLMWERGRIQLAALGYGAGLLTVLALGGYVSTDTSVGTAAAEVRNAGGFLDPNSFGFAGLAAVCLALLAWAGTGKNPRLKAALAGAGLVGGLAILQSGSRSAMMGALFAFIVIMIFTDNMSRKMNMLVAGGLVAVVSLAFMPGAMLESLKERASISRVRADRGANRLDIWTNYLEGLPSYAPAGVGFLRSREVIRGTYTSTFKLTHNQFLEVLVETGLLGLGLFCAGLARLWRAASLAGGPKEPLLRPMLLATLVALLTEFMFLNCFFSRETWILLGAVAGLAHHRRSDA